MLSCKSTSTLAGGFPPCKKAAMSENIGNFLMGGLAFNMLLCFENWSKNWDLRGLKDLSTISEQSVSVPSRQASLRERKFSHILFGNQVMFVNIKHILHLFSVSFAVLSFTGCIIQSQTCEAVCDDWSNKLTWPIACARRAQLKQTHEFLHYNAHITTPSQIGTFLEEAVQHQPFQISNY